MCPPSDLLQASGPTIAARWTSTCSKATGRTRCLRWTATASPGEHGEQLQGCHVDWAAAARHRLSQLTLFMRCTSCLLPCFTTCPSPTDPPRRSGAFATLKEGQSWHDPATRLLLSFEALGGCPGAPGLPLYNHSGERCRRASHIVLCPAHACCEGLHVHDEPAWCASPATEPVILLDPPALPAARDFYGYRGEWPQQEAFERADYTGGPDARSWQHGRLAGWEAALQSFCCIVRLSSNPASFRHCCHPPLYQGPTPPLGAAGFQGLECAQLVLTTAAPEPAGRLSFSVEAAPAAPSHAPIASRRRLRMQPGGGDEGSMAAEASESSMAAEAGEPIVVRCFGEPCGVPAAPVLQLRLPVGQRLASVIWKDGLNRTIHAEAGAELAAAADAAAAAGADSWTTAAVALPSQYPLEESSGELAPSCSGSPSCQQAQRRYMALVLAPDGRHSSVAVELAPANLIAHQVSLRYKHYEPHQLTYEQGSLLLPHPGASSFSGVALFDSTGSGTPLQLARSSSAMVSGSSLPDTHCSQQWSLSIMLRIGDQALAAASQAQVGCTCCWSCWVVSIRCWYFRHHVGTAMAGRSTLTTPCCAPVCAGRPGAAVSWRRLPGPQPGPVPAACRCCSACRPLAGVGHCPPPPGAASQLQLGPRPAPGSDQVRSSGCGVAFRKGSGGSGHGEEAEGACVPSAQPVRYPVTALKVLPSCSSQFMQCPTCQPHAAGTAAVWACGPTAVANG